MRGGSLVVGRGARAHALRALRRVERRAARRAPPAGEEHARLARAAVARLARSSEPANDPPRGRSKIRLLEELADFLRLAAQQRPLSFTSKSCSGRTARRGMRSSTSSRSSRASESSSRSAFARARTDDDALERWARLASRPRHHEMRLTRLTRDDVKRWLEGAMRGDEVGRDLLAYVYRHTEGNPLLLDAPAARPRGERPPRAAMTGGGDGAPPRAAAAGDPARAARAPSRRGCRDRRAGAGSGGRAGARLRRGAARADDAAADAGRRRGARRACRLPTCWCRRSSACAARTPSRTKRWRAPRDAPARRARDAFAAPPGGARAHRRGAGVSATEIAAHYEAAGAGLEAHEYALLAADAALALYETGAAAELLASAERTAPSPRSARRSARAHGVARGSRGTLRGGGGAVRARARLGTRSRGTGCARCA